MDRPTKLSRVDDAYERLKAEILENRMPPGFQGTEPEIAQRLDMSRTPVREALIRLQSDGLIELIPRRGVRVLPVAPSDMQEIYQLLTVLEPEAAGEVARVGLSAAQIAALEAATAEMDQALKEDDLDKWAAADDRFHRELLRCNGNSRLSAFVNTLFDQAHRARMVTLRLRDVPWKSTEEHQEILAALIAGDSKRTRKVFRAHRERAAAELLDVLEKCRLSQL
ncbi:MAG: GntR family transcriptional regulator [Alphaproteobacteria bacterium]|nr:GntR family transcriptional regulator [Alphaproteobacteria bacterium]